MNAKQSLYYIPFTFTQILESVPAFFLRLLPHLLFLCCITLFGSSHPPHASPPPARSEPHQSNLPVVHGVRGRLWGRGCLFPGVLQSNGETIWSWGLRREMGERGWRRLTQGAAWRHKWLLSSAVRCEGQTDTGRCGEQTNELHILHRGKKRKEGRGGWRQGGERKQEAWDVGGDREMRESREEAGRKEVRMMEGKQESWRILHLLS